MATYKKQLRDKDNNVIYPAQGLGTITNDNIDWTTTAQSYSTTEVDTGATWVDGKHIYKKTVDFGPLPNNTGKSVAHGITGISRVVKIEAIMYQGANSWVIPYTSVTSISVEGSNVVIYTNTNLTGFSAFVTAYYTKS